MIKTDNMDNESIDHIIVDAPFDIIDKDTLFKECYRIAKQDSFIAVFMPSQTIDEWVGSVKKAGFKVYEKFTIICENNNDNLTSSTHIQRITDDLYILKKGNPQIQINTIPYTEGTLIKIKYGFTKFHTLGKRLAFWKACIQNYIEGKSINDLPNANRISQKARVIKHLNLNINNFTYKEVLIKHLHTHTNITNLWVFDNTSKDFKSTIYTRIVNLISKKDDVVFYPFKLK